MSVYSLSFISSLVLIDHAEAIQTSRSEEATKITAEDLDEMESVLEEIAKERKLNIEQDALKGLKEEVSEYKEVMHLCVISEWLQMFNF